MVACSSAQRDQVSSWALAFRSWSSFSKFSWVSTGAEGEGMTGRLELEGFLMGMLFARAMVVLVEMENSDEGNGSGSG